MVCISLAPHQRENKRAMERQGSARDMVIWPTSQPRSPWEGHRKILLMKLGLRGLPYLIAVPTRLHFFLSTGVEKSDGSPKSTPCPEQDLVLAED